jgi:hypothetical protein
MIDHLSLGSCGGDVGSEKEEFDAVILREQPDGLEMTQTEAASPVPIATSPVLPL